MATLRPPAVAAPPPAVKGLHKVRLASMFASDPMEKKGPGGASRTRVKWKKCPTNVPLYQILRGTPSSGDIAADEARDECEGPVCRKSQLHLCHGPSPSQGRVAAPGWGSRPGGPSSDRAAVDPMTSQSLPGL